MTAKTVFLHTQVYHNFGSLVTPVFSIKQQMRFGVRHVPNLPTDMIDSSSSLGRVPVL